LGIALLIGTPFFVLFGWLSDKVGRKAIMMTGLLLAVFLYRPIYRQMYALTDAKAMKAGGNVLITQQCSLVGQPVATVQTEPTKADPAIKHSRVFIDTKTDSVYASGARFHYTKTDTLYLTNELAYDAGDNGTNEIWLKYQTDDGSGAVMRHKVKLKNQLKHGESPSRVDTLQTVTIRSYVGSETAAGKSHENRISAKPNITVLKNIAGDVKWYLIFLVFVQVLFVTMVYGPIAAFLVEMFPVKIRYTSMSLPYHVGNGIFGGLLPAISTYFVTTAKSAGNPEFYLEGLWYPIGIAAVSFIIGMIYIDRKINTLHD
jgi:hypothetical protein